MRISQPFQGWGSTPTDPSPEGTANLNAESKTESAEFQPPFGTNRLLIVFPALKRWAILTMSLRDKKDPGHHRISESHWL